jgi:Cu-Zn family superoxide dismutase
MKKIANVVAFVLIVGLSFFLQQNVAAQDEPLSAVALIKGTAPDSPILGTVKLSETDKGLLVQADIQNVPNPGPHGFHIHENGSCDEMGKAAGGHFNPDQVMHGMVMKDGLEHAHVGDMGNIVVDVNGTAKLSIILPDVTLENGKYNVDGLAIILHEKTDDFSQPTGNAGGRIACGIIEVQK